jgi:hypothetical protein
MFDFKKYSLLYCLRDVEITQKFMQIIFKLVNSFGIDFKEIFSTPSLALKIFEKKFNNNQIKLKYNFLLDVLIRPAYFGGRCEVYGNPKKNEKIFHFDFSGMYAQCMLQNFPHGKHTIIENNFDLNKPGYYYIEFYSKQEYLPILPHHRLKNNKLMFTNGILNGVYWYEEILLFLELGGKILKIKYGIIFEKFTPVFKPFVDYFTNIKEQNNTHKFFCKLIINSLYGRLGMDEPTSHSFFINQEDYEKYNSKYKILNRRPINDMDFIEVELSKKLQMELNLKQKKTKSNVSIAAAITSKARIKLLKAQLSVIENGGRLLYSDTDSIFAAYKRDVIDEKHGEVH